MPASDRRGLGSAKEPRAMPTPPTPWTSRIWQEFRAGNLTRAGRDVLLTLRTYRGHGGLICPSHATLADRARLPRQHGLAGATGCPRPRAGAMDRTPGARRVAQPEDQQPLCPDPARRAGAVRHARRALLCRMPEEGRVSSRKRLAREARQRWRPCWRRRSGCPTCWRRGGRLGRRGGCGFSRSLRGC